MRDPNRIIKHMNILTKVWSTMPDIRFHQMIHNLKNEFYNDTNQGIKREYRVEPFNQLDHISIDLFQVEDHQFFKWLEEKYK